MRFTLQAKLHETFSQLLMDLDTITQWSENGLLFAAKLCQCTGAPVWPKELINQVMGASVGGGARLRVGAANDVGATYERLQQMRVQESSLDNESESDDNVDFHAGTLRSF